MANIRKCECGRLYQRDYKDDGSDRESPAKMCDWCSDRLERQYEAQLESDRRVAKSALERSQLKDVK